jgi:regulator of protease activity HflC (stomatin/prohibitin superfamily)
MEMKGYIIWAIIVICLIFLFLINPFIIISAGEKGVVLNWGAVSETVLDEGLHFRVPFQQTVLVLDVKILKEESQAGAASKDLQEVKTTIALNYHLDPAKVNALIKGVGRDYKQRIIDPAMQEAVKAATAKYTAEELITKRALVKEDIKNLLATRLAKEYIMVDEVSITEFDFSPSFNKAIEDKVTAEQEALQAKNVLEKVKFQAEQRVAQAQAEAEAIRIQAESISKQGGQSYVQMKAIEKWDGKLPIQMIPGSAVPFIDLAQGQNNK